MTSYLQVRHPSGRTEHLVWDEWGLFTDPAGFEQPPRAVSYPEFVRTYLSLPGVEVTLR